MGAFSLIVVINLLNRRNELLKMLGRRSFEIFLIPNLASVRCHNCKRSALLTKPNILSPAKIFSSKTSQFYLSSRVEKDTTRTNNAEEVKRANRNYALYFTAGFFLFIGVAYASAPLYKAFCQATNLGGELNIHLRDEKAAKLETIDPVKEFGQITVKFYSAKESRLAWDFKPQQDSSRSTQAKQHWPFTRLQTRRVSR